MARNPSIATMVRKPGIAAMVRRMVVAVRGRSDVISVINEGDLGEAFPDAMRWSNFDGPLGAPAREDDLEA